MHTACSVVGFVNLEDSGPRMKGRCPLRAHRRAGSSICCLSLGHHDLSSFSGSPAPARAARASPLLPVRLSATSEPVQSFAFLQTNSHLELGLQSDGNESSQQAGLGPVTISVLLVLCCAAPLTASFIGGLPGWRASAALLHPLPAALGARQPSAENQAQPT